MDTKPPSQSSLERDARQLKREHARAHREVVTAEQMMLWLRLQCERCAARRAAQSLHERERTLYSSSNGVTELAPQCYLDSYVCTVSGYLTVLWLFPEEDFVVCDMEGTNQRSMKWVQQSHL